MGVNEPRNMKKKKNSKGNKHTKNNKFLVPGLSEQRQKKIVALGKENPHYVLGYN